VRNVWALCVGVSKMQSWMGSRWMIDWVADHAHMSTYEHRVIIFGMILAKARVVASLRSYHYRNVTACLTVRRDAKLHARPYGDWIHERTQ